MRTMPLISVSRLTRALALLALSLTHTPASAETINCTAILSLPATLSTQGIHCLMGNLATAQTSGNAITITANNVTLDLNGFKLGGQAAGSATDASGISSTATNTTIKNGIVKRAPALVMRDRTSKSLSRTRSRRNFPGSRFARPGLGRPAVEPRALPARAKRSPTMALRRDGLAASPARPRLPRTTRPRFALPGAQRRGFLSGITLTGRGAVVEDLLVDQNTANGIVVSGQGAIVRRNQVVDTGGSNFDPSVSASGIRAQGTGSLIAHNVVAGLTATGTLNEFGILVSGAHSLVRENFIIDTAKPTGGGTSQGIDLRAAFINVLNNTVSNMNTCILYVGSGTGLFAGNTVTGCDFTFSGGTAGQQGNNFIVP